MRNGDYVDLGTATNEFDSRLKSIPPFFEPAANECLFHDSRLMHSADGNRSGSTICCFCTADEVHAGLPETQKPSACSAAGLRIHILILWRIDT